MASKKSKSDALLVAAMDFGTTYSGYVFSMRDTPMDFQSPQVWYAGSTQLASLKTPTCLLLESQKQFHSFGYEAENKYAQLCENNEHREWYFFQHFKMLLHDHKNLSRSTLLEEIGGKPMQAIQVFSLSIDFLRKHLLQTLKMRAIGIIQSDIHFVLTVPAIWNDSAKQFMREAAIQAGIENEQLSLALEPEAASIFCQSIPTEKFASSMTFDVVKAGTEYMVIDLGGGTVDIAVHRKEVDGTLKTLHAASGGPWGGLAVNREYLKFLNDIVGIDTMDRFKRESMEDYLDILRDFETKKRTVTPDTFEDVTIRIPVTLKEIYAEKNKTSIEEDVRRTRRCEHIALKRDKLKIDAVFMKKFFEPAIESVVRHVSGIVRKPELKKVSRFLLVGGFSECQLVQKAFKDNFGDKRIIVPHEAGLAVVKGAVTFGHRPTIISSRILSYTYGNATSPIFKEGIHPEENRFIDRAGVHRCKNAFSIYKRAGETVRLGEKASKVNYPTTADQNVILYEVFCIAEQNPKYVTDKGSTKLGNLKIDLPAYTGKDRKVDVDYIFGDTEFMVELTERENKEKVRKYFQLPVE